MDMLKWIYFDNEKIKDEFENIKLTLKDNGYIVDSPEDVVSLKALIYSQLSSGYFKSERHKIAFMLTKYASRAFDEELGITRRHYVDNKLAKLWMGNMQSKFHPDKNLDIASDLDFTSISEGINQAYSEMVGRR